MSLTVIINAPPSSKTADCALKFCQAALSSDVIHMVYLLGESVCLASKKNVDKTWSQVASDIPVSCCVNSAHLHHLVDSSGRALAEFNGPLFKLSGLTELALATTTSDKVVTFGARS